MSDEIMVANHSPVSQITQTPGFKVEAGLDTNVLTAKAYPRNTLECVKKIISIISSDEELASSCYYTLPPNKGQDKGFQGPSVRLAEIFYSEWGNMDAGTRVVSNDGKQVVVEGFAWDLEKNNRISVQVAKSILKRDGTSYSPTMQQTTIGAATSIAYRNAMFKVIPFMYIEKVYKAAMDQIANMAKNIQYVEKAVRSLEKYNIMPMQVLSYFNKKMLSELLPEEVQEMTGIGIALRDGQITSAEAFTRSGSMNHDKDGVLIESKSPEEDLLNMLSVNE